MEMLKRGARLNIKPYVRIDIIASKELFSFSIHLGKNVTSRELLSTLLDTFTPKIVY